MGTPDELEQYLSGLGLGGYAAGFQARGVTLDSLPQLTQPELAELGVSSAPCSQTTHHSPWAVTPRPIAR
jgi:hypothetical protein